MSQPSMTCPRCKNPVQPGWVSCPACGNTLLPTSQMPPQQVQKKAGRSPVMFIVACIGVLACACIAGAFALMSRTPATTITQSTVVAASQPGAQPTTAASRQVAKVGERIESSGIALTIVKVTRPAQVQFGTPKQGNELVDIEVIVENSNRDAAPYNPLYFKIKDSDGQEFTTGFAALDPSLKAGTLQQGEKARGHVAFEVPKTAKGLVVSYEPLVLFGGYQILRISLE